MPNAVIVDAVRSPMGKGRAAKGERSGGALSGVHHVELLGQVLRQLVERTGVDPALVDDVITGCVSQVGEQSGPVGRWAWLSAGRRRGGAAGGGGPPPPGRHRAPPPP